MSNLDYDEEYFVAELVEDAKENHDVELSEEEQEHVAELQRIYNEVEFDEIAELTPAGQQYVTEADKRKLEVFVAEMIRRGRNMDDDEFDQTAQFFGIDSEQLRAELEAYDVQD